MAVLLDVCVRVVERVVLGVAVSVEVVEGLAPALKVVVVVWDTVGSAVDVPETDAVWDGEGVVEGVLVRAAVRLDVLVRVELRVDVIVIVGLGVTKGLRVGLAVIEGLGVTSDDLV